MFSGSLGEVFEVWVRVECAEEMDHKDISKYRNAVHSRSLPVILGCSLFLTCLS